MFMNDMTEVVLTYMEELDCARSLQVAILWRHREWKQLAQLRALPMHYRTATNYFDAVRASDFIRKSPSLETGIDRDEAARIKWFEAERANAKTNARFLNYVEGFYPDVDPRLVAFCDRVKRDISRLLGRLPDWITPRFGPGATVSDSSRVCTVPDKISSHPSITNSARTLLPLWRETYWGRVHHGRRSYEPTVVRGNIFFTVPKDGETDRACAKGPSINVAYQLAVSQETLRPALRKWGIDLLNAKDRHMGLARESSVTGHLATIDLSNASDMIARNVVKFLFPPVWFELLWMLCEKTTTFKGEGSSPDKTVFLEKFSAMGNGFTFEVETIIFAAIARACCVGREKEVAVNGDDIIVPTEHATEVVAALRWFGFIPNVKKTFLDGPFRESCGGDYWEGQAVRPHFLDKQFPSEPQHWISLANGLRRVAPECKKTWFRVLDRLPTRVRKLRGPEELGDLVIHDELCHWQTRTIDSIRYVRTYSPAHFLRVEWDRFMDVEQLATLTYGVVINPPPVLGHAPDESERFIVPRDGVTGYALGWVPFS